MHLWKTWYIPYITNCTQLIYVFCNISNIKRRWKLNLDIANSFLSNSGNVLTLPYDQWPKKWPIEEGKFCGTNKYILDQKEPYTFLGTAINRCSSDPNCVMVVDHTCKKDMTQSSPYNFWLCPSSSKISASKDGSCIHVKRKNYILCL